MLFRPICAVEDWRNTLNWVNGIRMNVLRLPPLANLPEDDKGDDGDREFTCPIARALNGSTDGGTYTVDGSNGDVPEYAERVIAALDRQRDSI